MASNSELRKRPVRPEDFESIEEICRPVTFDVGCHNLKLYYEACPRGWEVVVDKNEKIVAVASTNILSDDLMYGYITVIIDEYQGRGLSKLLMRDYLDEPFMGSSGEMSLVRHGMCGLYWLEKRHGMYGFVKKSASDHLVIPDITDVKIDIVRSEHADTLIAYDRSIHPIDRSEFVRKWSTPPELGDYGASVLALDEITGQCVGYGTLRLFSDYYSIQPLYAENEEIAGALMIALVKWCFRECGNLYMPLMADKRKALEFCYSLGMVITGTEIRNCGRLMLDFAKSLPICKVYAVHEFYPV